MNTVHAAVTTVRLGFVMEQQVGMKTHYLNWRRVVDREPNIHATWVPITYYKSDGMMERLKFVPGRFRAAWRSYRQVEQGLGRTKYDAVLFNTFNPAVVNRKAARAQPSFLMFDVTPIQYDGLSRWYNHKLDNFRMMASWKHQRVCETLQEAQGLFAWSHWAASSAMEDYGVNPECIHYAPPGVDTALWNPGNLEDKPKDGICRILFIGYNFERKGGDLLIRWAKETSRRNWEIHMVTELKMNVPPGVFIHTGLDINSGGLIKLAQQCDVFALPTRADCFSIASLEAMAVGMPVITSRVGGIPDIVIDGKTGYLLDVDDYTGLSDRLNTLIDTPELRHTLGQNGRNVVLNQFDSKECVKRGLRLMTGEALV